MDLHSPAFPNQLSATACVARAATATVAKENFMIVEIQDVSVGKRKVDESCKSFLRCGVNSWQLLGWKLFQGSKKHNQQQSV